MVIYMFTTAEQCIAYIHSLSRFGKKAGLDNITALCSVLGNPQDRLKFVHVAGTNGKGSVCAMLTSILSKKYKVGCYISPYIEIFNERIQICGEPISDKDLVEYTCRVKSACDSIEDFHPIEFEFITAMGFLYFLEKGCDLVVLETGLGGRFDATNIIHSPLLCVISAIGLDHMNILGDTVEKIAFEKAGIIKNGASVVLHPDIPEGAYEVIEDRCACVGAVVCNKDKYDVRNINYAIGGTDFEYKGLSYHLPLCGTYQVGNATLAIDAAYALKEQLDITDRDISDGIADVKWKCRFEVIRRGGRICIIDGAHNSHGIDAFCDSVETLLEGVPRTFVFGMLNDKDFGASIERICSIDADIIVTDVPSYRQTDSTAVCAGVKKYRPDSRYVADCHEAVRVGLANTPTGGALCVFGSLYLCGEVRGELVEL